MKYKVVITYMFVEEADDKYTAEELAFEELAEAPIPDDIHIEEVA